METRDHKEWAIIQLGNARSGITEEPAAKKTRRVGFWKNVLVCEPSSRPTISSEYRSGVRWDPGHSSDGLSGGEPVPGASSTILQTHALRQAQRDLKAVENEQAYGGMRRPSKACAKLLMLEITGGNIRHAFHGYFEKNPDAISAVYDAAGKSDNQDAIPEKFVTEVREFLVNTVQATELFLGNETPVFSEVHVITKVKNGRTKHRLIWIARRRGSPEARDVPSGLSYLR